MKFNKAPLPMFATLMLSSIPVLGNADGPNVMRPAVRPAL